MFNTNFNNNYFSITTTKTNTQINKNKIAESQQNMTKKEQRKEEGTKKFRLL